MMPEATVCDWPFHPLYPARVLREGPTVLKVRLEDKKLLARRKDATVIRKVREVHIFTREELATALGIYETFGEDLALTRRNWDAKDPTNETVGKWRFAKPLRYVWDGDDSYPTAVDFEEDVNG